MERFFMKEPGKLDKVIGTITGFALFFAYRIGLGVGAVWPYALLVLLSVLVLVISAEDMFIKICAITAFLYSVVSLIYPAFYERWFWFYFVGKVLAAAFSMVVLFFGFLIGSFWRWLIWGLIYGVCLFFTASKRKELPQTKSIYQKGKWIYLHDNYDDKKTELIYRNGKKKRILDTYPWEENRCPDYFIEMTGDKSVTVRKYNKMIAKKEYEKTYEIKNKPKV